MNIMFQGLISELLARNSRNHRKDHDHQKKIRRWQSIRPTRYWMCRIQPTTIATLKQCRTASAAGSILITQSLIVLATHQFPPLNFLHHRICRYLRTNIVIMSLVSVLSTSYILFLNDLTKSYEKTMIHRNTRDFWIISDIYPEFW